MIDTSAYRIVVDIDQLDLRHIAVGQNVIVKVDSFPELLLRGNVTRNGWLPAVVQRRGLVPGRGDRGRRF